MSHWTPSLHPRDESGRFKSKGSVGLRVSTRSVSATAGYRIPIVPGKINVFVGGLVRVENASRAKGPIDRFVDRKTDQVLSKLPDGATSNIIKGLVSNGQYKNGSTLVQGNTGRRSAPTLRVGRSTAKATNNANTGAVQTTRSPNRKPRVPRQPRARRVA